MNRRAIGIILMVLGILVLLLGVTAMGQELPTFQLTGTFTDNFEDGNIDSRWTTWTGGDPDPGDQQMLEEGGNLICRTPSVNSWCGVVTSSRYAFGTGGTLSVQVVSQLNTVSAVLGLGESTDPSINTYRIINHKAYNVVIAKYWDASGVGTEVGSRNGLADTLSLEIDGHTLYFIADGSQFASMTLGTTDLYAFLWGSSGAGFVGDVNFDNFALDTGGEIPGTGTLIVQCWVDGTLTDPVMGQITISPDVGTVFTTSTGTWEGTVNSGTYTASATIAGESKSKVGTVPDGGSVTIDLTWGTGPADDWMEIFKDPAVKAAVSMCGVGMFGVGLVFVAKPGAQRKRYSYSI